MLCQLDQAGLAAQAQVCSLSCGWQPDNAWLAGQAAGLSCTDLICEGL